MIGKTGQAALCVLAVAMPMAAVAQDTQVDPLGTGQVLEWSLGLYAPWNTLQDTLTTPNGGGPQLTSTDILDVGTGARVGLSYSRPWGAESRLVVNLVGSHASDTTAFGIGTSAETFPGSYDDGLNLPAGWTFEMGVKTRVRMLSVGREWSMGEQWRFSAGVQGGTASQDMSGLLLAAEGPGTAEGEPWRALNTRSNNKMLGVFGGVSHYTEMRPGLGLRLSGTLGVMHNDFDYHYVNVLLPTDIAPFGQEVSGSRSGMAVSTRLSVRLEQQVQDNGTLVFEAGYDGLYGVGNGVDTFLDVDGTRDSAAMDRDSIAASYLSVGYAISF